MRFLVVLLIIVFVLVSIIADLIITNMDISNCNSLYKHGASITIEFDENREYAISSSQPITLSAESAHGALLTEASGSGRIRLPQWVDSYGVYQQPFPTGTWSSNHDVKARIFAFEGSQVEATCHMLLSRADMYGENALGCMVIGFAAAFLVAMIYAINHMD